MVFDVWRQGYFYFIRIPWHRIDTSIQLFHIKIIFVASAEKKETAERHLEI